MEIRSVSVSSCRFLLVFGGASCPCGEPGMGLGSKISPVCGDSFYTLLPIDARGVRGNRTSYKTRGNVGPFAKTTARSWMCTSSTTQEPNRSPTDGTPSLHPGLAGARPADSVQQSTLWLGTHSFWRLEMYHRAKLILVHRTLHYPLNHSSFPASLPPS